MRLAGRAIVNALSICRAVRKLSDAELDDLERMAKGQLAYLSPLKMATSARQHALGNHNLLVLTKLRELRDAIKAGEKLGAR
jgi:hypothetical protein